MSPVRNLAEWNSFNVPCDHNSVQLAAVLTALEKGTTARLAAANGNPEIIPHKAKTEKALPNKVAVPEKTYISLPPEPEATDDVTYQQVADAVVMVDDELVIVDLKYGRGVKVDADRNEQLTIYALAALDEFGFLGDFQRVRLVIVQPRLNHTSEWAVPVADLDVFRADVATGAERCRAAVVYYDKYGELHEKYMEPGEKQCRFCKAKAICPALTNHVLTAVADDFVDVTRPVAPQIEHAAERTFDNAVLGNLMGAVDLVETWCKAIRAKGEAELMAGNPVPGFKLVEGRRGARKWADPDEVETTLKAMRLKTEQIYDLSLISPTTAEKLHKNGNIGPRQWPKLQALITQPSGKPSVAPESDKRPALAVKPTVDDFDDLSAEGLV